jgi:hypothetical protein
MAAGHPSGPQCSFDRRQLLISSGLGAAFLALRPWRTFVTTSSLSAQDRLAGLLRPDASVRRVGLAFLRSHPDEADPVRLVDTLMRAVDVDRADLGVHTAEVIRAELRSREIVRIDGWIASPTEARLAALVTLVS